jgi:hypothetical protein
LQFLPEQLQYLLDRRAPRLPEWFMVGLQNFFEGAVFADDTITFGPIAWGPDEEVSRIRRDSDYAPVMLAMEDVLVRPCPPLSGETLAAAKVWRAHATLFVRWMLATDARRARLWKLLARIGEAPMTDDLCRETTGLSFGDTRERLGDYLREAMTKDKFVLRARSLEALPDVDIREASPGEIARVKGDWERLGANWVRARHPRFVDQYVRQARRTLTQAYDRGERDPRLLAVMGLFECEVGDEAAALPLLEAAAAARVVRPRVYFELARLRYAAARAQLPGERQLLNSVEVNTVLAPFKIGALQEPPLLESARLVAEAWSHSTAPLGPEQLAACDRFLKFYPNDPGLIFNVTLIKALHGRPAEAAALAQRGLDASEHPEAKVQFAKLLSRLTASLPTETKPR